MKNFKSFVAEEKPNIKRKAKGEQDFVDAHEVEITDPTDQGNNSAKVTTKANSGKHKNDRADNKQEFGEAVKKTYQVSGKALAAKMRQNPSLKAFADKVEKMSIVTPQMVDKILPDYISGGEITKLFKESVEESVKPDVEKAFPASGVRKHTAPKGTNTMPKDKEKAKGKPAGSFKEETDLEEETKTYMVKFEKDGKVSLKNYEATSDLDARSKAKVDAKRMGMNVSSVRLKEEVEELDELSKETLKSYVQGAKKDVAQRKKAFSKGTVLPPIAGRKQYNRLRGMHIAKNKMDEEVEQIEESQVHKVVKQKDGTHDVHVKTEFGEIKHIGTIHAPDKEGVRVAKYKDGTKVAMSKNVDDLAKRLSGYHGKHMREEVEELDELSKSTLGNYIKKAHHQQIYSGKNKNDKDIAKTIKRSIGVRKAVGRLTKEEVELDEEQLREFDLYEGYEKKVLDYLDRKGIDAEFVSGKLQVNKRDVAKAKAALSRASGFDASDLEVVAEAAYTNPGLERLAAAKKRNQPSHTNPGLEALAKKKKSLRQMRKEMTEADFSKQQTKMAHTIGKEFEKKGVGDESQGGPYAVASAMVRDKPEAAKKAYKTIQSKMKEEADAELLFNLYNDLNEENQEMFMSQLEEDAEALLEFAQRFLAD